MPQPAGSAEGQRRAEVGPSASRRSGSARAHLRKAAGACLAALLVARGATAAGAQEWSAVLTVQCGTAAVDLVFGQCPEATPGLDRALGEDELPPLPPSGSFDARFLDPALGNGTAHNLLPFDAARTDTLLIGIQWGSGERTVRWDAAGVAAVTSMALLTDSWGGQLGVNIDMRAAGQVTITNARVERLWLRVQSAVPAPDTSTTIQRRTWGQVKLSDR